MKRPKFTFGYTCALSLTCIASFAAPKEGSSPTLLATFEQRQGRFLLYEQFLPRRFRLDDRDIITTVTLYYVERHAVEGKRQRIWERGFWENFKRQSLRKPRGFVLAGADDYSSRVGIAFWEMYDVQFYEVDANRPIGQRFQESLKQNADKHVSQLSRAIKYDYIPKTIPHDCLPQWDWSPLVDNPPKITGLWHSNEGWHMTIAATKPEMHLVLRHGTKEWVWINKP